MGKNAQNIFSSAVHEYNDCTFCKIIYKILNKHVVFVVFHSTDFVFHFCLEKNVCGDTIVKISI